MGREGVHVSSFFNCFINALGLGMSSSLLALSAVQHSIGWATFAFVCLLWSSYQITREIYL